MAKLILKAILFITIVVIPFNAVYADDDEKTEILQKENGNKGSNKKPRTPSKDIIYCTYGTGYMELTIPAGVEYIDVTLSQSGCIIWSDVVTADEPRISIPVTISGEILVTCNTDTGETYSGILNF